MVDSVDSFTAKDRFVFAVAASHCGDGDGGDSRCPRCYCYWDLLVFHCWHWSDSRVITVVGESGGGDDSRCDCCY